LQMLINTGIAPEFQRCPKEKNSPNKPNRSEQKNDKQKIIIYCRNLWHNIWSGTINNTGLKGL
jgi:hypothetical protein